MTEQCSGVGDCFSAAAPPYPMGPPPGYAPPSYSHPGSEPYPPGVGGPPPVPPRQQSGSLPNGSAEVQYGVHVCVCVICMFVSCVCCVMCGVSCVWCVCVSCVMYVSAHGMCVCMLQACACMQFQV